MNGPNKSEVELMEAYWRDIRHLQPLARETEAELVRRARQGDDEARHQLVQANLRFVVHVAREFAGGSVSMIELVAEGNMGLLEAARRFDEERGHKFITYAIWWIRQAMYRVLTEKRLVRPPANQKQDLREIERRRDGLTQQLGRAPAVEEIAAVAQLSLDRAVRALQAGQSDKSFDAPLQADEDNSLLNYAVADGPLPEEACEKRELGEALAHCLEQLDDREARILRWYFGWGGQVPMTLEQIGTVFGLTRERVRQIRDGALAKLRQGYGDMLGDFRANLIG